MTNNIVFIDLSHVYGKPACTVLDKENQIFISEKDQYNPSQVHFDESQMSDKEKSVIPKGFFNPTSLTRKDAFRQIFRNLSDSTSSISDVAASALLAKALYKDEFGEDL